MLWTSNNRVPAAIAFCSHLFLKMEARARARARVCVCVCVCVCERVRKNVYQIEEFLNL